MAEIAMPRLSDSMEEGTILKWLKADGDEVKRGEELVEIETDKANMTYEADQDGVLKIVAQEGDTLPVGETIARDRKSTRLNSSHANISNAVFCLKKTKSHLPSSLHPRPSLHSPCCLL